MAQPVRLAVMPEATQVAPGGQSTVALTVENAAGRHFWYRLAVSGVPADWYDLTPPRIALRPAARAQVHLTVHPPSGTGAAAGRYAITVQVKAEEDPAIEASARLALTVSTGSGLAMEVEPTDVEGRAATFRLTYRNHSPVPAALALVAQDSEERLHCHITPAEPLIVPAGDATSITVDVVPKVRETIGAPHTHEIMFRALLLGTTRTSNPDLVRQARFTYVPPLTAPALRALPSWVRCLPVWTVLLPLVLLCVLLVFAADRSLASTLTRMTGTPRPGPRHVVPAVQPVRPRATAPRRTRSPSVPSIGRFTLAHRQQGQPYELVWQTRDARQVLLDGWPVAARGSVVLQAPLYSTEYRLVAMNGSRRATAHVHVVVDARTTDPRAVMLTTPDIATFAVRHRHGQQYAVWRVRHAVYVQLQGRPVASAGERPVPSAPGVSTLRLVAGNDVGIRQMLLPITFPGEGPAIRAENALPGTTTWDLTNPSVPTHRIEGYANLTSVNVGGRIGFYVNVSPATSYTMEIFRMGWYHGAGARLVWYVPNLAGRAQPACPTEATLRMVHCAWVRSYTLTIPRTWISGVYLCRLTRADGFQSYIIFVVRDDASRSTFLFQSSVTTYQAYNMWGGRSLYGGPGRTAAQKYAHRSYAVSFDRPYDRNHGAGDFFYWEYPMLRWLERSGYDVTYSTDLDTDASASRPLRHKAFLSVGHDEYWSEGMRDNVEAARQHGVSLGFFGADAAAWRVRLEPSGLGPRRVMVCYKDPAIDPGYRAHRPDLATVMWRDPLIGRPEQLLIGQMYEGLFDSPDYPLRPVNTTAWPYAGTGLHNGAILPRIVGYEYDRVFPTVPTPKGLLILAASRVVDMYGKRSVANVTLYTAPSGARVFAAGTIVWSWGLDDGPLDAGYPEGAVHQVASADVQRITANILDNFAR